MPEEPSAPSLPRPPTVFRTHDGDPESARLAATRRSAGYAVVDVALSTLVARTEAQRPHVILADIDAHGTLAELERVRKLPGAGAIDFVFVGRCGGPLR